MSKPDDELVEAVKARAKAADAITDYDDWIIDSAITAYHEELERRGMMVVPVEPTMKMYEAVGPDYSSYDRRIEYVYERLLAAWKKESGQ